jgi:hypothetical protein
MAASLFPALEQRLMTSKNAWVSSTGLAAAETSTSQKPNVHLFYAIPQPVTVKIDPAGTFF